MANLRAAMDLKLTGVPGKFQAWAAKLGKEGFEKIEANVTAVLLVLGGSYLAATVASGFIMTMMTGSIIDSRARLTSRPIEISMAEITGASTVNTRDIMKAVKERNIFNSEGKFPEEKFGGEVKGSGAVFDIDAPCRPTTLPIELMGTIFLGDRFKSIATVRDKSYSEADIYRVGDEIYGSEGAVVAAVDRQALIINNLGSKECIELNKPLPGQGSDGFPSVGGGDFGGTPNSGAGGGSEITLESSYVESELGPGFAKIMDAARFVPNTVDNQVNGFKLFAIQGGSLLSKIGLQNNDVVTQVNDTSLKQADQGFAFYQALQDEKEVRIQILRGGTTPMNITVRVK